jgi:hypothetical protein
VGRSRDDAIEALLARRISGKAVLLRSTVVLDETFVYPVGDPNPCPFEVTYRNQGTFFVTTFVDANGNTIRELDRSAYFLESYSANGQVISSKSPAMIHVDPATNPIVGTGNQRHFIVPGARHRVRAGRPVRNRPEHRRDDFRVRSRRPAQRTAVRRARALGSVRRWSCRRGRRGKRSRRGRHTWHATPPTIVPASRTISGSSARAEGSITLRLKADPAREPPGDRTEYQACLGRQGNVSNDV